MYILGGSYYTATSVIYPIRFSFSETYVFDTVIGSWSLVKLNAASNSRIPSDRVYHSATMSMYKDHLSLIDLQLFFIVPNSQDILVYGGTNDGRIGKKKNNELHTHSPFFGRIAVTDYCYTLNLDTNTWTEQVNVSVPTSVTANGSRFAHTGIHNHLFLMNLES